MTGTPLRTRIATRRAYRGRLLTVDVDTVQAPDGSTLELEMVRHPGAAAVVPFFTHPGSSDPQVLLLRQFRYATGGSIWEIPAGVLEPGEDPTSCAHRELAEETGATAARMDRMTTIYTTPGFTDEQIHLFLATDLTRGEPKPMTDEFLVVETRPLKQALRMIRDGSIVDAKSIVGLLFAAEFTLGL